MNLCPICGAPCYSHTEFRRCSSCGVLRTIYDYDPALYDESYASTYLTYSKTPVNVPLCLARLGLVSHWLREDQSLLDIGCGIGEFIKFAEKYYSKCAGFDPNSTAVEIAKKRVGYSPIYQKLNGDVGLRDMITMFDVIEHVQEPRKFLEMLVSKFLKPKGILVITTPNVGCIPMWAGHEEYEKWKHFKPREHLFLYTFTGLGKLFPSDEWQVLSMGHGECSIRPGNSNNDLLTYAVRKR